VAISCLSLEELIYLTKRRKRTRRVKFMKRNQRKIIHNTEGKKKNLDELSIEGLTPNFSVIDIAHPVC
jgi:hypothetical protein